MLEFFRRLFSQPAKPADPPLAGQKPNGQDANDFFRLNSLIPLQATDNAQSAFVCRESILNRAEKVAGYELSIGTKSLAYRSQGGEVAKQTYDDAFFDRLALYEVPSLLGHRLALINLSPDSLSNPLIARLRPLNTVLVLDIPDSTRDSVDLLERIAELREIGFAFGVKITQATEVNHPLILHADFIQIDVTAFDGLDLRTKTRNWKKKSSFEATEPPQLVARDVQNDDDFQFCRKCGFDLFQGPFISSRESLRPTRSKINYQIILPVLGMLRNDQSFSLIADQLKNEPTMTYKLLRYINSASAGLQKRIDTLTEALVILGRERFYRWTSLLLFDFEKPGYHERILAERALSRGRTLELIAGKGCIPDDRDNFFLVGLFSLLDQALGRPLSELLEKVALPDVVRNALLRNDGIYADALAMVISGETDTFASQEQIVMALTRCRIGYADYFRASAAALDWAHQTLSGDAEQPEKTCAV